MLKFPIHVPTYFLRLECIISDCELSEALNHLIHPSSFLSLLQQVKGASLHMLGTRVTYSHHVQDKRGTETETPQKTSSPHKKV